MSDSGFVNALTNLSPEKRALLAEMLRPAPEPIAIIGMACRFPGGANSPEQFWRILAEGRDAVTEVPADRWPVEAYYDPNPAAPGKTTSRHGAFIDQVDQFDAAFFGIAPREANRMDPQQRLFMEVAWEALEHAGQTLDGLAGSATGVYAAVYQGDYSSLQLADVPNIDGYVASGISHAIVANRLSHFLDVRGPSLAIDTACSSSLVALHLAVQSLRQKESDMAIVGGVNLMISPLTVLAVARWGAIAPDGRIKAFDASADGIVRGEGCGVLVLKRLADARRDGDRILAVCRGTAVNQDGRTNVLTAPNGLAQKRVLEEALRNAGLRGEQVAYIEAHGTGTPLGDPIEMEALLAVYGHGHVSPLWVGSVKTNIGHLEAAAGMAGLIKSVLVLQHGLIPPHLHFHALNPHISLGETPLVIPIEPQPWSPIAGELRRAAVSSFGFGGTNAHIILEEAPVVAQGPGFGHANARASAEGLDVQSPVLRDVSAVGMAADANQPPFVLALSAPQPVTLPALARVYRAALDEWQAQGTRLADICYSAALRRTHFNHRLAVAGRSHAEMAAALDAYLAGKPHAALSAGRRAAGPAIGPVFIFSGQGVQWEGMARDLYRRYPVFRVAMDECGASFQPHLGLSIVAVIHGEGTASADSPLPVTGLSDTFLAQPAIFAVQVALVALWDSWGIRPAAVIGHSLGEVTAAYVAGALSLDDAVQIVAARSRLMQTITGQGKMAAVSQAPDMLLPRLSRYAGLSVAAANGPSSTVIAGDQAELAEFLAEIESTGARTQYLPVNYAFHSPQVRPLVQPLLRQLAAIRPHKSRLPLASTVTGKTIGGYSLDAAYWGQNMAEPVLFAQAIAGLIENGFTTFLEISPHPALGLYVEQALERSDRQGVVAFSLQRGRDEALTMLANLGRLYTHGATPEWQTLMGEAHFVSLPTYPWQHRRYWFEPGHAPAPRPTQNAVLLHPLLQRQLRSPLVKGALFESVLTAQSPAFQGDHRIHDVLVVPATTYLEMVTAAAHILFGPGVHTIRGLVIRDALVVPGDDQVTLQLAVSEGEPGQAVDFQIFAARGDSPDDWRLYVRGKLETSALGQSAIGVFDPATVQARCDETIDGEAYYQLGHEYGGELGPRFRSIRRLWRRPGEVVGQLEMASLLEPEAAGYTVHPAYMDAIFHIAYAALLGDLPAAGILMPVSFDEICIYRPAGSKGWCHFELRSGGERGLVVGDVRLYSDDGKLVAEAKGVRYLRATGQEVLLRHVRLSSRDLLYRVVWQLQPPATPAVAGLPAATGWLILAGENGYGRALAGVLQERGCSVALAYRGDSYRVAAGDPFYLDPLDPDHYRRLLNSDWIRQLPAGFGVVDLWLVDEPSAVNWERAGELAGSGDIARILLPQLFLSQAVAAYAGAAPPKLWLVTRLAQPAGPGRLELEGSLVWGFGRTLALEHPGVFGGLIDLGDHSPGAAATILAAELLEPDGENQLAWRGDQRLVARLARVTDSPTRASAPAEDTPPIPPALPVIDAGATYLITGATGGIGRHLARWLVEQGARHLLLLSRTAAGAELQPFLTALRAGGAEVRLEGVDVADANALARVFVGARESMPPLKGVFHAAGVVADAAILQLTPGRLAEVMSAKVGGAWNLHRYTAAMPLDFFVLFSSAAAVLGSPGQANYSAANAFLDALAHDRRSQGLPALSINWGPWQAGMAAAVGAKGRQRWDAWGIEMLKPVQALQLLARLLVTPEPQVAVLLMQWPPKTNLALAHIMRGPLFRELLRGLPQLPVSVAERQPPKLLQELAGLPARRQKQVLVDYLRQQIAAILGWESGHDIDPQQGFFEIGLDSLTAVELKERVDSALDLPQALPATVAFDYPTLDGLAGYLLAKMSTNSGGVPSTPAPPASGDGLENLPEHELATLLAEELRKIEKGE